MRPLTVRGMITPTGSPWARWWISPPTLDVILMRKDPPSTPSSSTPPTCWERGRGRGLPHRQQAPEPARRQREALHRLVCRAHPDHAGDPPRRQAARLPRRAQGRDPALDGMGRRLHLPHAKEDDANVGVIIETLTAHGNQNRTWPRPICPPSRARGQAGAGGGRRAGALPPGAHPGPGRDPRQLAAAGVARPVPERGRLGHRPRGGA